MHLSLNAVACAMRTKNSGVRDRRARSARYPECTNVVCFDLALGHAFDHLPGERLRNRLAQQREKRRGQVQH